MGKQIKGQIIVENTPGAGGTIAAKKVVNAQKDGHTLLIHHIGMSTAPALYKNLGFDPLNDYDELGLQSRLGFGGKQCGGKGGFNQSRRIARYGKAKINPLGLLGPKSQWRMMDAMKHIKEGKRVPGSKGSERFENRDRSLPSETMKGEPINYQKWDLGPKKPECNRGDERIITGSDGRNYYTNDHYKTFYEIINIKWW